MPKRVLRRIVIVGATSAIAVEAARHLLKGGPRDFILIGRDQERLEEVATDLRVRSAGTSAEVLVVSMTDADDIAEAASDLARREGSDSLDGSLPGGGELEAGGGEGDDAGPDASDEDEETAEPGDGFSAGAAGGIDAVLIAHGSMVSQQQAQRDIALVEYSLTVNAVSPALFAEAFAGVLERQGYGTLAVIGSVAGDRGRKSNYIYGAAKTLLEHYLQGVRHRLAKTEVRVLLIKPGPTDTPMTAELKARGARGLANRRQVGASIARALGRRSGVIYVPGRWRLIMAAIRGLPFFLFRKLDI